MLRLFHSIFGDAPGTDHYPESLVREATERAVDGTDPWLRGLSGYRRKLRPAVLHAIDHVVSLVEQLEPPLELSLTGYDRDPQLRLFFYSAGQLAGVLESDPALAEFRREAAHTGQAAWALMTMDCEQRHSFGVALFGDTLVRDVPQVTVGMANHRLVDPTANLAETRRLLKRRAFDHLLSLALARIAATRDVRQDMLNHRTLLQSKLDCLQRADWGFSDPSRAVPLPAAELQGELADIERQLLELGGDDRYIEKNLEILAGILADAEHQLWSEPVVLIVDRMGIKRAAAGDDAPELHLQELHNAAGRRLIARLVKVPATDFSPTG